MNLSIKNNPTVVYGASNLTEGFWKTTTSENESLFVLVTDVPKKGSAFWSNLMVIKSGRNYPLKIIISEYQTRMFVKLEGEVTLSF